MIDRRLHYDDCERGPCRHELARAVTLADLFSGDGPFPTVRWSRRSSPPTAPRWQVGDTAP